MAKGAAAEPQRSCIACRRTGDKSSFIRFVPAAAVSFAVSGDGQLVQIGSR
jgi:predicted RNA-binding protein YlxR (DUF448 family)